MIKALIVLVILVFCNALRVKLSNLDDTIDFVTCSAQWATQGPHLLSENKSFWFTTDGKAYNCVVATTNFKFKAFPLDNSSQTDYGYYFMKDGIYSGSFDGAKNLQLKYGW